MDIRRPYTGEEEQSDVGEVVHRKEEESYQIGGSLHQTVDGVEGDGCPGS